MTTQQTTSMEEVLVVKRSLFDEIGSFQGFSKQSDTYMEQFLAAENNFFMRRDEAEENPQFKQIIPYAVLLHNNKILAYKRGKSSGEARLHDKMSIGIGGHINPSDHRHSSLGKVTYLTGIQRELEEELVFTGGFQQKIVGLINDDSNEVGQVHLGVVHFFNMEYAQVSSNEDSIVEPLFYSYQELKEQHYSRLESWSQIVLDAMHEQFV